MAAWSNQCSDVQSKMAWICTFRWNGAVFVSQMNERPQSEAQTELDWRKPELDIVIVLTTCIVPLKYEEV